MDKTAESSLPAVIHSVDESGSEHTMSVCPRCKRPGALATEWARVGGYYAGKACADCCRAIDREQE